ncbi:rac guanine nucleotide exchange factor JJ-like [Planococcus citri]|uniref:rac guanine nucleotide exchange factor JJ-like n=1 Tax=Planococcus citri TaxID=170843 RepID=UPI0031F73727
MDKNICSTPEPSLAVELRSALLKENILTTKTKKRVLDALDEHITNDEDRKIAIRRKKTIQEIYSSEESYLSQLEKLVKFFKKPMEEQKMAPISILNILFGNIESIQDVNKEFLSLLKENKGNVASAFLSTAPFFKLYSAYAYNYRNVISILESLPKTNPTLQDFISKQETRPEVTSKISSLLIAPVQRIPRYLLLLKELKSLTPEPSFASAELEEAIKEISIIVDHIQSLIKEQECMSRMLFIQKSLLNGKPSIIVPGRKLVKEGKLMKVVKSELSARYIVLLNDMILYCKDWNGSSLKCLRVLPISKCVINAIGFKKGVFSVQCQSFSVVLCSVDDPQVAHEWVEAIQNVIDQHKEDRKMLRKQSSQRRPLRRRDFNQLEDPNDILRKKRKTTSENDEVCVISPWKKLKTCSTVQTLESDKVSEKKEKLQEGTSYLKLAKQLITSVKQTTQKIVSEVDGGICQPVSSKPAITD